MGWFDWMRGMVGYWPKVFARACMRAPVLGVLFFLLSQVSQRMEWKTYFTLKTTGRFVKSDRLFYEK